MRTFRIVLAWTWLIGSTLGLLITMPLWLTGRISDRSMIGVTLALSWLSLMEVGFDTVMSAHDYSGGDGSADHTP